MYNYLTRKIIFSGACGRGESCGCGFLLTLLKNNNDTSQCKFRDFRFIATGLDIMLFVILLEGFIISKYLGVKWNNIETYFLTLASNAASGVMGFIISMILNGGWWLVIWFPWVSNNEVNLASAESFNWLMIYYGCAFVLTIIIETCCNILFFNKMGKIKIIKATLIANTISYIIGSALLYCYSFDVF